MTTKQTGEGKLPLPSIKESTNAVIERFERILKGEPHAPSLETGFPDLDRIIGGLKPGNLVVIASLSLIHI